MTFVIFFMLFFYGTPNMEYLDGQEPAGENK
jgi:hypothetical protein